MYDEGAIPGGASKWCCPLFGVAVVCCGAALQPARERSRGVASDRVKLFSEGQLATGNKTRQPEGSRTAGCQRPKACRDPPTCSCFGWRARRRPRPLKLQRVDHCSPARIPRMRGVLHPSNPSLLGKQKSASTRQNTRTHSSHRVAPLPPAGRCVSTASPFPHWHASASVSSTLFPTYLSIFNLATPFASSCSSSFALSPSAKEAHLYCTSGCPIVLLFFFSVTVRQTL